MAKPKAIFDLPNGYKAKLSISNSPETYLIDDIYCSIHTPQGKPCGEIKGYVFMETTSGDADGTCQSGFDFAYFLEEYSKPIAGLYNYGKTNYFNSNILGFITTLRVNKEHRGQKVGMTAVKKLVAYLFDDDLDAVFWQPQPFNEKGPEKVGARALAATYKKYLPNVKSIKGPGISYQYSVPYV